MSERRRRSIDIGGFSHANPVPAASQIGPFVFSGIITGRHPETGVMGETLDEQCAFIFRHLRAIIEAAGGTLDDVIKVTFWVAEYRNRTAINREWVSLFPEAESRPARQVMFAQLDDGMLVQCDFVGVLGDHIG